MKLWLVLYAGAKIVGTWGPLPYGMDECRSRADDRRQDINELIQAGVNSKGEKIPEETIAMMETFRIGCEYHAYRPKLDD